MTPVPSTAVIAPALKRYTQPIAEVHPHPSNPRRGDVDGIAESLERFGQLAPVLALPDGTIVAGNHTYRAARKLGWLKIAVVYADLSADDAEAYLIADNRLSDMATYDQEALLDLLRAVKDLDGTTFQASDVDELAAKLAKLAARNEAEPDYADPRVAPAPTGRQVVIELDAADFDTFAGHTRTLAGAWATTNLSWIVLLALEALDAGQAAAP